MKHAILAWLLCLGVAQGEDYGHLWWAEGLRGEARVLHVQTSHYGFALDTTRAAITRLGRIGAPAGYAEAAVQGNAVIAALPESSLRLEVEAGGMRYACTRAAATLDDHTNYPVRLIEAGRWLNRFDVLGLEFTDAEGNRLPADARLEVAAWPRHVHLALEVTPAGTVAPLKLRMALTGAGDEVLREAEGGTSVHLTWDTEPAGLGVEIEARDARAPDAGLPVAWAPLSGAFVVDLPERQWAVAEEPDRLDRFPVAIKNTGNDPVRVPLVFAFEGAFSGVTGMCPMLRDPLGVPTGIPVQISKNWHRLKDRRLLYDGAWFHAVTMVEVPPGGAWQGELAIAYARWGGVPSVSHAQLSLIGWGGNQRWEQVAIGSFGESICYDPDVGLNRAMIDDVRPLMVRGMNDGPWEWTHNVGGGDFLVYHDAGGTKQFLTRVKTASLAPGPNLSHSVYAGASADRKIEARIEVLTPRCDDVNRAYHRVRYDVRERAPFTRLAFYQLGADQYNDHQFTTIARGNADGLVEEWPTERGGKKYLRQGLMCEGRAPWLALLGGMRPASISKGAWADRAVVVRAWRARLGGQEAPVPVAAVYGTENGPHSANVEFVPPPGVTELLPGDFVEAEFELLVLPQRTEDYHGPNAALKEALAAGGGTWKLAHWLAKGNELKVEATRGTVRRNLPIEIEVDATGRAECRVSGGLGHVPVRFSGLPAASGRLRVDGTSLDQAVHGNDYWQAEIEEQTGKYVLTYSVLLQGIRALVEFSAN